MTILSLGRWRRRRALALHEEAMRLSEQGRNAEAIRRYSKSLELDPARPTTLFNLALIFKYRNEWERSLELNLKAHAFAPNDEATRWNAAIAATALGQWTVARQMWTEVGIDLPGDDGPIEGDFGQTPVRLDPDGDGEVVWAHRLDPVRARIESIPLPESGYHRGDIVLHDGAAVGRRRIAGRELPVFNVLERLESSEEMTWTAQVEALDARAIGRLGVLADYASVAMEDWTASLQAVCRQCSESTPHAAHDKDLAARSWQNHRRIGLSAKDSAVVESLMVEWASATDSRLVELVCQTAPAARSADS